MNVLLLLVLLGDSLASFYLVQKKRNVRTPNEEEKREREVESTTLEEFSLVDSFSKNSPLLFDSPHQVLSFLCSFPSLAPLILAFNVSFQISLILSFKLFPFSSNSLVILVHDLA